MKCPQHSVYDRQLCYLYTQSDTVRQMKVYQCFRHHHMIAYYVNLLVDVQKMKEIGDEN